MTLQEWLKRAEAHLALAAHPDRARRDAELLLQFVLRTERAALLARWNEVLARDEAEIYVRVVNRRTAGEPIQYILGETEFYGLPFKVAPGVLIPRPETEHVVEKAIELAGGFREPRIVDVGTGSGAIAVALARQLPAARVTAVDVSALALDIASENAERNRVGSQIRFLQGDLLEPVRGERFDLVVSNPPYVAAGDRDSLAAEVRDYEPAGALFAGQDGLDVIRRLIPGAWAALKSGGRLLMEFGYGQWPAVSGLLEEAGFALIEFVPDLQGIPRVACSQRT